MNLTDNMLSEKSWTQDFIYIKLWNKQNSPTVKESGKMVGGLEMFCILMTDGYICPSQNSKNYTL